MLHARPTFPGKYIPVFDSQGYLDISVSFYLSVLNLLCNCVDTNWVSSLYKLV